MKLLLRSTTCLFLLLLLCGILPSQVYATDCHGQQILTAATCTGDGVESEELKLHQLVNDYRAQYSLPAISLSKSLTLVANRHVLDLSENIGSLTHGWSNCPYDAGDTNSYQCMWKAPQRLGTAYPGYGYENAHGGSGSYTATASSALTSWKNSSSHNAVILNQGVWQKRPWSALGVGIYKGYAVLWFGEEVDPAGSPTDASVIPITPTKNGSYLITSDLWINASIQTIEKGAISALWHKGGEAPTSRGDKVIWGYFYANPADVSWGNENNPDAFVKIWYDVSGRVDVNFFHVSVPDIEVYSGFSKGNYDNGSRVTTGDRYTRHVYQR